MPNALRTLLGGAYSLAWTVARPLLRRHKRLRDGFEQRLAPEGWAGTAGERVDIWLQAASGGEAYLVWELLRHLAALREAAGGEPLRVLTTTWTRQGLDVLQDMASRLREAHPWLSVHAAFFPLDAPGVMEKAIGQARPRVVGLLETELWPGLMLACRRKGVPFVIANGRMTEKSLRNYLRLESLAPGFWGEMPPERVCAISDTDGARFAELFGAERVETVPNIKFDRAAGASGGVVSEGLSRLLPCEAHAGKTVLLASVREQEEPDILAVVQALRETGATIVIAPRHMHRVEPWQALLGAAGIAPVLRSGRERAFEPGNVVIWDTFGELGQLYQLADAVFVGGSLAPLGGQNILEPLALGRIPCTGPHLENFTWALGASEAGAADSLEALGLLRRGGNAAAVATLLREQLAMPEPAEAVRERFGAWLTPRLGGASRCARSLLDVLDSKGR